MIIDGNAVARRRLAALGAEVAQAELVPHLTIITVAPDFVTQKYLTSKKQSAERVGIAVNIIECDPELTTAELTTVVTRAVAYTNGVIVQLPLPTHIDTESVLSAIPASHDVDAFRYERGESRVLPPVVGAIVALADEAGLTDWVKKRVVVVGRGRLVGKPAARYFTEAGAEVTIVDKATDSSVREAAFMAADVIISGAGVPHMITADMVKAGVVIFDAGTSEESGKLAGDVAPEVADKAVLFTPVPGGVGPLTIVSLLENVVKLAGYDTTRTAT